MIIVAMFFPVFLIKIHCAATYIPSEVDDYLSKIMTEKQYTDCITTLVKIQKRSLPLSVLPMKLHVLQVNGNCG